MDTRHLEEFLTLARTGSFKSAAKELYIANTTLSAHVAALEAEVGTQLLVKRPSGVRLTTAGRALASSVPGVLADIERACESSRWAAQHTVNVRIAAGYSTSNFESFVMAARRSFCATHPDVTVDVETVPVNSLGIDAIKNAEVDLAMYNGLHAGNDVTQVSLDEPYSAIYLGTDDIFFVAMRGGDLYEKARAGQPICMKDLDGLEYLTFVDGGWDTSKEQLDVMFAQSGVRIAPRVVQINSYWDYCYYDDPTVVRIVARPALSHYDIESSSDLAAFRLADLDVRCDVFAVCDESSVDPAAQPFIEELRRQGESRQVQ